MSLSVEVKKLSQDVSIEDGQAITQNFVLFVLPNGGLVKAAIDDVAAEALLDALVRGADSVKAPQQDQGYEPPRHVRRHDPPRGGPSDDVPAGFRPTTMGDGSQALEFGGEGDARPSLEEPELPVRPAGKVRAVGKDVMGYPVLRGTGNVQDPGEVSNGVGVEGSDEDGVASV
jgi:hypothetical protein